jgi:Lipocalin-like domain
MNRSNTFGVTSIVLLGLALNLAFPASSAVAQSAKDLVGIWTPVSVEAFNPNPKGILIFDANGHFSLQLLRSNLPKITSNKRDAATPDENKQIVGGSIAYYGTYSLDGTNLKFHIEACSFPNWTGTDQTRSNVTITGDELKYTNTAPSVGGPAAVLVWKRVK